MDTRTWAYHKDKPEGRIFSSPEDIPSGWADSPAKIDERDAVDLEAMTKAELDEHAATLGMNIDGRWSKSKMIEAINDHTSA